MENGHGSSNELKRRKNRPTIKEEATMKKFLLAVAMCFAFSGMAVAAVNINTATKEELTSLKGVGEKRAQEIIDYRKKNGDFKSIDDLQKVPGIGPGLMKQIRSDVTVTGKTTVAADTKSKGAEPAKTKAMETKKSEPSKADATKAEKAKEKSKSDEKGKAEKKGEEKAEKKSAEKATKKTGDTKETKDEKKAQTK
jgi:competence protein ComEA